MKKFIIGVALTLLISLNAAAQMFVMDVGTPINSESVITCGLGDDFDRNAVREKWDENYDIISAGYGRQGWIICMAKGMNYEDQSMITSENWPTDWVDEKLSNGFAITSLGYGNGEFFVCTSKGSKFYDQRIASMPWSQMKDWIKKLWDQDYYITDAVFAKGQWTIVMSKCSQYVAQAYMWGKDWTEMDEKISNKWKDDYYITSLNDGNGQLFCIMTRFRTGAIGKPTDQTYFCRKDDYKEKLKEFWDKNFNVVFIGNGR